MQLGASKNILAAILCPYIRWRQAIQAEILEGFLAERDKSLTWLKSLSAPNWEAEYIDQHGSIKAGEMFASWVAHDNLHTRQLVELRRQRIVSLAEPFDVGYAGDRIPL